MPDLDSILSQLADAGVQTTFIDQIRAATDPSPLRKNLDEANTKNTALAEENAKLRSATLSNTWKAVGAAGDPTYLNFPSELDITSADAVREFAVKAGYAPAEPAQHPDAKTLDNIASASTAAAPPNAPDKRGAFLSAEYRNFDDFAAAARSAGFTS